MSPSNLSNLPLAHLMKTIVSSTWFFGLNTAAPQVAGDLRLAPGGQKCHSDCVSVTSTAKPILCQLGLTSER